MCYYFLDPDDPMIALCDQIAPVYREALMGGMGDRQGEIRIALFFGFLL